VQRIAKGRVTGNKKLSPVKQRVGIFAGSFDPPTLGHQDLIRRASLLLDELVVAVGAADGKSPLFTTAERVAMTQALCSEYKNVRVISFDGLTVDCALAEGATTIIRGVRSAIDYDYEMRMALMNQAMKPQLQTIFLPTRAELSHISSSLAKEIARHGGDSRLLVPSLVARELKKKFSKKITKKR
jgi:pantetheine-phosphate adenylyltransferase